MEEKSIQSMGGRARAQSLSDEERKAIARKAAAVRWDLPRATHFGSISLGGYGIGCANLNDGTRILIERSVATSLGRKGSGAHWKKKREGGKDAQLPEYLSFRNLQPFIPDEIRGSLMTPITYITKSGQESQGIPATLLPEICKIWLTARREGALTDSQQETARRAEILALALAHVGIIALIDEATGYQTERDKDELQRILELYVRNEFLPWTKKFPNEYYQQLFRLRGWNYSPINVKRPILIGTLTNKIVYKKLPTGVLEDLKKKNPKTSKGYRRYKYFQFLTEDIGNPHLEKHLASVITLMRVSKDWRHFEHLLDQAFPPARVKQIEMELNDKNSYDE